MSLELLGRSVAGMAFRSEIDGDAAMITHSL
jgi:hypothetical protein